MNAKCPFLEELLVAYCSVCPVKKMIAKDQLISQNPCETDYANCPIFKEFLAKQTKEAKMANYDCKSCEFDQALLDQSGTYTESPMVVKAIEKLRQLPASERKCRYMLTGDFSYKICSNNYECWHCAVDQYVQDTIEADPYLQKRRQRLAKKEKKVKGFTIREDFYYLPNHIWIKVEGEVVKIGIDDFAAHLIGKMENVELPDKNVISKDDACWRFGSHNRMVRMTLPTDTEIIEKNDLVLSDPTIIQKEPYGRGWLLKIKSPAGVGNMLKGSQAIDWLEKEFEKLHQEFEEHVGITITDGGEIVDNIHERLTNEEWNRLVTRFLS